ncbi:hypothetical protein, partial [endosymbiont of Riftia pachyptila]
GPIEGVFDRHCLPLLLLGGATSQAYLTSAETNGHRIRAARVSVADDTPYQKRRKSPHANLQAGHQI